jgi:DNA-binding NarL/FixJ family response regulator
LHHRIALAIESLYPHDLAAHLSALIYHHQSALPMGDASKFVQLAIQAAEQAETLLAHEEAMRYYRMALQTMEARRPQEPALKCSVLLKLAKAQERAGETLDALQPTRLAFEIAKELEATREIAQASLAFENLGQMVSLPGETAVGMLLEALHRLGNSHDALKAQVLSALGRALSFMGRLEESNRSAEEAIQVARRTGDPTVLAKTLAATLEGYYLQGGQFEARCLITDEAVRFAEQTNDPYLLLNALSWKLAYLWESGDFSAYASIFSTFMRIAEANRFPLWIYHGTCAQATLALHEGRFKDCESLARRALELGRRLPGWDAHAGYSVQMFSLFREQGRLKQLAPLVAQFVSTTDRFKTWRPGLMILYVELDQEKDARALFDNLSANEFVDLPRDGTWTTSMVYLAETCAYLGDEARALKLYEFLLPYDGRNVSTGFPLALHGPIGRQLGRLAAIMKRWNDAERHFTGALTMSARQGTRPAIAHTQFEFAQMLASRKQAGDIDKALELLDEAIAISGELEMRAIEERALALRTRLEASREKTVHPGGLSHREVEVLRLVSEGKSNQEIAETLFRSPNTVANHVRNILAKIDASNRAEAVSFAARHGLLDQ